MSRIRGLALFFASAVLAAAQHGQPLFVALESNPWSMVVGSDSPRFAYYDDGTVIYRRIGEDKRFHYYIVEVEDSESLQKRLFPENRRDFPSDFMLTEAFDQPENILYWHDKRVLIYGHLDKNPFKQHERVDQQELLFISPETWHEIPRELIEAYNEAITFQSLHAREWIPEFIELLFWPGSSVSHEALDWPQDWPDLESPTTVLRHDHLYSVYLPSEIFPEFKNLLQESHRYFRINGREMVASFRFPFPEEHLWMEGANK